MNKTRTRFVLVCILAAFCISLEGMSFTRYYSENYKKPDLRQQRQLAQHLLRCEHAQRDHHKQLRDENRRDRAHMLVAFVKRHKKSGEKQQVVESGKLEKAQKIVQREQKREQRVVKRFGLDDTGTKVILAFTLASLCLASDGVCLAEKIAATNPTGSNPVVSVPYSDEQEENTWGPCEEIIQNSLSHGSKLCCDIGANYTVTCCKHETSAFDANCVVFDPDGVRGLQPLVQVDVKKVLKQARWSCLRQSGECLYFPEGCMVKNEIEVLLDRPHQGICPLGLSGGASTPLDWTFYQNTPKGKLSCNVSLCELDQADAPTLNGMLQKFTWQYHLNKVPRVFLYDDKLCDPYLQRNPRVENQELRIPYVFLKNRDLWQEGSYGHEAFHVNQNGTASGLDRLTGLSSRTGNNFEVEADLASMLATGDRCWLVDWFLIDDEAVLKVPLITKENVHIVMAGNKTHPHPSNTRRKLFIAQMYEFYKEARRLLGV